MDLRAYKIICENNRPVTAQLLDGVNYKQLIKLTKAGGKKYIKWFVVVDNNAKEAIHTADCIIHTFWEAYLSH